MEREHHILLLRNIATVVERIDMTIEYNNPDETQMTGIEIAQALSWIREATIQVREFVEQETGLRTEDDNACDPNCEPNHDFLFL